MPIEPFVSRFQTPTFAPPEARIADQAVSAALAKLLAATLPGHRFCRRRRLHRRQFKAGATCFLGMTVNLSQITERQSITMPVYIALLFYRHAVSSTVASSLCLFASYVVALLTATTIYDDHWLCPCGNRNDCLLPRNIEFVRHHSDFNTCWTPHTRSPSEKSSSVLHTNSLPTIQVKDDGSRRGRKEVRRSTEETLRLHLSKRTQELLQVRRDRIQRASRTEKGCQC